VGSEPARLRLSVDTAGLEIVLHAGVPAQPARLRGAALRGQAHPVAAPVVEVAVVIPAGREAQREHETALLARVEVLLGAGVEREVSPQAPRPVEPGRAVRGAGGRPVADVVRSRGAEPAAADPGLELVAGTQRRAVPARGQ